MRLPTRRPHTLDWTSLAPLVSLPLLAIVCLLAMDHWAGGEQEGSGRLFESLGWADIPVSPSRLTIDVRPDGAVEVAGGVLTATELDQRIRQHVAASTGNLEVQIQGRRDVPFRHVARVMAACARAEVWNVSLALK